MTGRSYLSRHATAPGLTARDPDAVAEEAKTYKRGFWSSDQAVARADAITHMIGMVCIGFVVTGGIVMLAASFLGLVFGDWTGSGNEFGAAMSKVAIFAMVSLIGGTTAFLWFFGLTCGAIAGGQMISRFGWVVTVPWSLWVVWGVVIIGPLNKATAGFVGDQLQLSGLSEWLYRVGQHTVLWSVGALVLSAGFFVLPVLNARDPKAPMNRDDDGEVPGVRAVPRPARLLRVVSFGLIAVTVVLFVIGLIKGDSVSLLIATNYTSSPYQPMAVVAALSSLPPLGLLVLGLVGARLAAPHGRVTARANPVWAHPRELVRLRRHEADDMGGQTDGTRPFGLAARADIGGGVALVVLMLIGVLSDVLPTVPTDSEYLWSPAMTSLQVIALSLAGAIVVAVVALLIVTVVRTHGRWNGLDPWLVASASLLVLITVHRVFCVFWLPDIIWTYDNGDNSWGMLDAWVRAGWGLALAYVVLRGLFWIIEPARMRRADEE